MKKLIIIVIICIVGFSSLFYVYKKTPRSLLMPNLSYELPKGVDSSYTDNMHSLGLTNVKNINNIVYIKQRIYWKNTHNLKFMGDEEMSKFLKDNDFVIAPSNSYIGDIPNEAGVQLISNYKKLYPPTIVYRLWAYANDEKHTYFLKRNNLLIDVDGSIEDLELHKVIKKEIIDSLKLPSDELWQILYEDMNTAVIQIIGGRKYFNLEGLIEESPGIFSKSPPIDPIAVVKVDHGYVELANWE